MLGVCVVNLSVGGTYMLELDGTRLAGVNMYEGLFQKMLEIEHQIGSILTKDRSRGHQNQSTKLDRILYKILKTIGRMY